MVGTRLWTCQRRGCTDGWSNHLRLSLLFPFKVFSIRSREKAPVGRGLTFVPGDVETRIRPITGRHSLLPTSQARTPSDPLAVHLPLRAEIRGYHVPLLKSARG